MERIEKTLLASGVELIAGVDEAGRGPCAGPLVVAAVILPAPYNDEWDAIRDSKQLRESERERLFSLICEKALSYSIIEISPSEIDELGLHKSNIEGMRRAIAGLSTAPDYILTDGYAIDGLAAPSLAVWKGDQVSLTIGAASILAKVYRDRVMKRMDLQYPGYGFAAHKGYITAVHTQAINSLGVLPIHRRSFANIKGALHKE